MSISLMRIPSPSSRGFFSIRLSVFDTVWACVSPILALSFRDYFIFSSELAPTVALYWSVAVFFSLMAFLIFRIRDGMARYFSVDDALDVGKAVIFAELMTCLVLFTVNRLDGIPRSTPLIHGLILFVGLVIARAVLRMIDNHHPEIGQRRLASKCEHIIVIGSTSLSSLYINLLHAYFPGRRRVVAVLDSRPQMIGRAISGTPIVGFPEHLGAIITEYALHGIRTNRVIVGGDASLLSIGELEEIHCVCERLGIKLDFVPELIGLGDLEAHPVEIAVVRGGDPESIRVRPYLRLKRCIDFVAALILLLLLLPLLACASLLALLDVGSPVFFWQQRVGLGGRTFLVYKFRTLRPPFDWRGRPIPQDKRLSRIGLLLRESHLDELPQLLNVLVGDMSLIGPRPLLPEDQPSNPARRLMVRPGITGWAQVNGAKLLTPSEKQGLDEWYVCNASLWLDLRIILMTLQIASGARRSDEGATDKVRMDRREPGSQQEGASRPKHAT